MPVLSTEKSYMRHVKVFHEKYGFLYLFLKEKIKGHCIIGRM